MSQLTEQEFRVKSDDALRQAQQALFPLADLNDFEVELQNGVLQIIFEEPIETKFVVSPNAPVRQIWVSAQARSYKLPWSSEAKTFVFNGEPLQMLLDRLVKSQCSQVEPNV